MPEDEDENNDAVQRALETAPSEEIRRASFEEEEQRQLQEELDQAIEEQERKREKTRVPSKGLPKEGWESSLFDSEIEYELSAPERTPPVKPMQRVTSKGLPSGGWEDDLLQDELTTGFIEQEKKKVRESREKHPYAALLGDYITAREQRIQAKEEQRKREDAELDDPDALVHIGIVGYAVGKGKRAVKQSAEYHWEKSKKDFFTAPKSIRKPSQAFPTNLLFNINPPPRTTTSRKTKKQRASARQPPVSSYGGMDLIRFEPGNIMGGFQPQPKPRRTKRSTQSGNNWFGGGFLF